MTWSTPRTWVDGEYVDDIIMNAHVRDQFDAIGDAWTSFTPALVGWTLGNGTLTGQMKQTGKHVRGEIIFTFGSSSATSGNLRLSLPVTKAVVGGGASAIGPIGTAGLVDGATRYWRTAFASSSTEMQFASEADVRVTGTVPFTWGTGDILTVEFDYQAA